MHCVYQYTCNHIVWWCECKEIGSAPVLVRLSISSGLLAIAFGGSLVAKEIVLFMGPLALLPHIPFFRKEIESEYYKQVKDGCKNSIQSAWGSLVALNAVLLLICLVVPNMATTNVVPTTIVLWGTYVLIVIAFYFLATDQMPPGYGEEPSLAHS